MYMGIDFKIKWGPKSPTEITYNLRNNSTWISVLVPEPKELEVSLQLTDQKSSMCDFLILFCQQNLVPSEKTGRSYQMRLECAYLLFILHYYWIDNTFWLATESNSSY